MGVLHFHLHLYGHEFSVVFDHRPLIPLFNKSTSTPNTTLVAEATGV